MQDTEPNYLMGIICTILPRPHQRMGILLISGQRILGSPRQPGILRRRRVLLLPTLHTDEIYKWTFWWTRRKRGEKPPKEFSSTFQLSAFKFCRIKVCRFHSFWSGFHHLFIAFAIHAPSFPFSDSLCIGIWASLLWLPLWFFFVYPGHFLCFFSVFASFLLDSINYDILVSYQSSLVCSSDYLYPFFNTQGFYQCHFSGERNLFDPIL